ncbi:trans-sialidase [Trypanosoma cruzi]|nr:trans-sialidase [Trypanosoma cruzi]
MLQDGHRGCVYVSAELVGSYAKIRTPEMLGAGVSFFYIGGDEGGSGSSATVTNFFLYNRPLSVGALKMVRKSEGSMLGGVLRVLLLLGLCGFAALYGRNTAGPLPPVGAICTSPRTLLNN